MKTVGVILLGGNGKRLSPLTLGINKHLLPVYNKPMFYYSLSLLMLAGIREIVFICNKKDIFFYKKYFGNGDKLGCRFYYEYQDKPLGIAHGLKIAFNLFKKNVNIFMVLGDQFIFSYSLQNRLKKIIDSNMSAILTYNIDQPEGYGVLIKEKNNYHIVEKPDSYVSSQVVTGIYYYKRENLKYLNSIKKSIRGEFEITDLNNILLEKKYLKVFNLGRGDCWLDIGDTRRLMQASRLVESIEESNNKKISCPEEIALRQNFINKNQFASIINENNFNDDYKNYLVKVYDSV